MATTEYDASTRLLDAANESVTLDPVTKAGDPDVDEYEDQPPSPENETDDSTLSPLDEALEKIGFGAYQKALLLLCGFGWMADNMWLQAIAVILPRVQQHFSISDLWSGLLSTSIFSGMMIGATVWGSYSDARGRTPAFNLTLLLTSVFGIAAAFAPSFAWLCFALFWLGTGVGGSMPTDGTLFLENSPPSHHYLLTALSVFFSLGAVLTSLLGVTIIPRFSCPELPEGGAICDVEKENNGWRIMLGCLSGVSICMCLSRVLFFRLRESAKFLVSSGRPAQAVLALEQISRYNGEPTSFKLKDVVDDVPPSRDEITSRTPERIFDYETMGETPSRGVSLDVPRITVQDEAGDEVRTDQYDEERASDEPRIPQRRESKGSNGRRRWTENLPANYAVKIDEYLYRIEHLFDPELRRTTTLVWSIWFFASAGYTIFNVFLPKYLEEKVGESTGGGGRTRSLWDYVLYTVSGLPGALLGAWLIETSLGKVKTLAYSTLATSAGTLVFVLVTSQFGVVLSSMMVSLAATLMYAVIYGFTPAMFPVQSRATATGLASALSRLAGIIAPIVTGLLLNISVSTPLFLSSVCFGVAAVAAWCLPNDSRSSRT